MTHLPLLDYLKVFMNYCIRPVHRKPLIEEPKYSMKNLIGGFFVLFAGYMILMSLLSPLLGLDDMDHAMVGLMDQIPMWGIFIVAVIVAPIIEELIFRFPLKFFNTSFPVFFFAFTIVFAALHIDKFSGTVADWKTPLLIIPQLFLGFYLGFVRMQFSWPHAVGIHMFNNLIPTLMLIASDMMGLEM